MKTYNQLILAVLTSGLAAISTAQAQYITGHQYLDNIYPGGGGALYGSWNSANVSQTPTGLRVQSSGYGSGYFIINGPDVQAINPLATQFQLTLTVGGNANDYNWVSPSPVILNDDLPAPTSFTYYLPYSGSGNPGNPANAVWNGNTVTITMALDPAQLAKVQGGNDHVYAFNLGFDAPVLINGRNSYDITFNSLQFIPVPEPSSLALAALSAVAFLAFRRRS
jgi:hypothetical protein